MHGANLYKIIEKLSSFELFIFLYFNKKIDLKPCFKPIFLILECVYCGNQPHFE